MIKENLVESKPVQPSVDQAKSNKQKLVWGLICLIGPTALIVVSIVAFALVNLISSNVAHHTPTPAIYCDESSDANSRSVDCAPQEPLFADDSVLQRITGIVLFLVGAFSVITWLPGIIVGIILLATRKT